MRSRAKLWRKTKRCKRRWRKGQQEMREPFGLAPFAISPPYLPSSHSTRTRNVHMDLRLLHRLRFFPTHQTEFEEENNVQQCVATFVKLILWVAERHCQIRAIASRFKNCYGKYSRRIFIQPLIS
jgi:hypothetical protein